MDSPLCISCGSGSEEDLYHRMWACPKSRSIWQIANNLLELANFSPIFEKEVFLTDYENNPLTPYNQVIYYTRWYIDQAKTQDSNPNLLAYPSALFNVLYEQQKRVKNTPLFSQYEIFLNAIFYFGHNQNPAESDCRVT